MSTFRNPVGPESPTVYWRRRLVVGIGVVVVLVIILLIVFAPKGSKTPTAIHSSSTPVASAPAATNSSASAPACAASDLVVTATIDKTKFTVEEQPQFAFTIENKGKAACTATVGSDVQVFTVTSGTDTIWSSADCQKTPIPATPVIKPGEKLTGGPLAWDRTRSSKTTCSATRTAVVAGFYHVTVTVNGIKSAVSPQFQLT